MLGTPKIARALDVACGTGLSTIALADRAQFAVGVDATEAMVALAPTSVHVAYGVAQAERLPFGAKSFDLVTVASGVHWFRQNDFFAEAARVLDRNGALVFYDHPFEGCVDEPAIKEWLENRFETRYPTPPHGARPDEEMTAARFIELEALVYQDEVRFTHGEFISNSNTIQAESHGRETFEETEAWLRAETEQWFRSSESHPFLFRGIVRTFRLMD
jgi:SAM-dependent methyltransferase